MVEILDGRRVPVNATERALRQGQVPYYGATGQVGWIDDALFDEELVLLGEDGAPFLEYGRPKAYSISGPSWVNNHAHVLRATDVTTRFLTHYLNTIDYRPFVNGTTRLKLTQGSMREIPVPVPPRDEQRNVVASIEALLSRADAAATSLRRVHERLTVARASLLASAVSGALIGARVTPNGWPLVRINDVVARLQYGTSSKTSTDLAGVPVLRMVNIRDGRVDYTNLKYLPTGHADIAETLLEDGDILFNRTNSPELVGKCAVFTGHPGRVSFASYLVRLSPLPEVNPTWLAAAINSPMGREYIASVRTQQVGQANVSAKKIGAMPIRVPPRDVQDAIAVELERQIEGLDLVSRAAQSNSARASLLRQSILTSAFTGELVRTVVIAQSDRVARAGFVPVPTGPAS